MIRDPDVCAKAAVSLLDAVVAQRGGVRRDSQRVACGQVARSLASGTHVLIEAQTGTGKSLAYLAAIAAWGGRAVVSTASKSLQRQLLESDLPVVTATLAQSGRSWRGALLQGRSNYLCRVRSAAARTPTQASLLSGRPDPIELSALFAWEDGDPATGNRADAPMPVSSATWAAVSMGPGECPGASRCDAGESCFAEAARRAAADSQIVICNHHLVAYHLRFGGVLPDFDALIVDEAHDLEPIVTTALAVRLTGGRIAAILQGAGVSAPLRRTLAGRFEDALAGAGTARLTEVPADLGAALQAVATAVDMACGPSSTPPDGAVVDADVTDTGGVERQSRLNAARDLRNDVRRVQSLDASDVVWGDGAGLSVAPLDVSPLLAVKLFDTTPTILVSATLRVGGGFQPTAQKLGLRAVEDLTTVGPGRFDTMVDFDEYVTAPFADDGRYDEDGADGAWPDDGIDSAQLVRPAAAKISAPRGARFAETLLVDSPFDYGRQALLYLPGRLPDPTSAREDFDTAVAEQARQLMEAAGGRTLALFSSKAARDRAAAAVTASWDGGAVLVQGEGTDAAVASRFRSDATASLFATLGFWQGFDVPGDTCTVVIIDRIPFSSPADVLAQARIDAAGRDGWNQVSLARAAVLLAQGAGRLIRTERDYGVVAICDPRLTGTKRYASTLQSSLPPMRRTSKMAVVRRFLDEHRFGPST